MPITDINMTRFNISLNDGVEMVLHALETSWGGEIFVPKIPSYRITDVAKAIAPTCEQKVVGIRPGEKVHEEMISSSDSFSTYDLGRYYAILPQAPIWDLKEFIKNFKAVEVTPGFNYNSGSNPELLSVDQIREMIQEHVDNKFSWEEY